MVLENKWSILLTVRLCAWVCDFLYQIQINFFLASFKELLSTRKLGNEGKSLNHLPLPLIQMKRTRNSWISHPLVFFFCTTLSFIFFYDWQPLGLAFHLETFVPHFLALLSCLIFWHPFAAICIKWIVSLSRIHLNEWNIFVFMSVITP